MHYNMDSSPPLPDQSSIELMIADSVDRRAVFLPAPADGFFIPAGDPDVEYEETWPVRDAIPDLVRLELDVGVDDPIAMYDVGLHMHQLGTETSTELIRQDGSTECLLDIHHWEFEWQGLFAPVNPTLVYPEDSLTLRCSWDNSPENQPWVNGEQQDPRDVTWGDGSTDEMCLGMYYIARPE